MFLLNQNNASLYIVAWAGFTLMAIGSCFWMIRAIRERREHTTGGMVVFIASGIVTAILSLNLAQAVEWVYGLSGYQANIIKGSVTTLCLVAAIYAIVRIKEINKKSPH